MTSSPDAIPPVRATEVHSDGEDAGDDLPVKRRHKQLIRRSSSFKKFTSISGTVNTWFFDNDALHAKLRAFAEQNYKKSSAFAPVSKSNGDTPSGGVGGRSELDIHSKAIHEEFCVMFEEELEKFLGSKNVTMDEFQETFKIENEEERRDGAHFYRWMEIVEFEVFLELMRGTAAANGSGEAGLKALHQKVEALSEEAKEAYRKRSTIRPLLIRWCPPNFNVIANVLQSTQKSIPHHLDKATLKSMLTWKTKLTAKVMDDGVYRDPLPDEDAWTRYLALYTSKMSDKEFCNFVAEVEGHIAASEEGASDQAKNRQICWQCFAACDPVHEGVVDLNAIVKLMEKAKLFSSEKEKKKLLMKWKAQSQQSSTKPAHEPGEEPPINLDLSQFSKMLEDIIGDVDTDPQGFRTKVTVLLKLAENKL